MKKRLFPWLLGWCLLAPVLAASAGEQVSLKLVLAQKTKTGVMDKGLSDLKGLLKSNLSYNSYTLLGLKVVPLTNTPRISLAEGVSVAFSSVKEHSLNLRINQGKKQVLAARINLRPDKPTVLGGFSGKKGTLMVILTLL